jgi:hypothetical protein
MGCFFVGRVAESELIGAGKQWSLAVLSSQLSIIHGIKMKSPSDIKNNVNAIESYAWG